MIRSLFSIDTRSLAALRIGLASLILYRAITERAPDSTPPPAGFFELLTAYAGALVVPFAVMLLLGYKTRLATVLTWLVYTIPIREDLLTSGSTVFLGNYILALMLFWGFFLPLGDTLSIDSRQRSASGPTRFLSIASGGILLQVFVIYFSAGITRDIGEWLFQADALETILGQTRFASELGRSMTEFPILLAALSIATIALELIGTVLLFVPGKSLEQRRVLVVIAFILFHAGMFFLMDIGIFPFVMMTVWLLFLPSSVWDRITRRRSTARSCSTPTACEASALRSSSFTSLSRMQSPGSTSPITRDGRQRGSSSAGTCSSISSGRCLPCLPVSFSWSAGFPPRSEKSYITQCHVVRAEIVQSFPNQVEELNLISRGKRPEAFCCSSKLRPPAEKLLGPDLIDNVMLF